MEANLIFDETKFCLFDTERPIDISIPLRFNGPQPNAYGAGPATSAACVADELIGDTRQGGSCNFEQYRLIPHCNGTHTECVGHITNERISVRDCLQDVFLFGPLVSVQPTESDHGDLVITRHSLETVFLQRSFTHDNPGLNKLRNAIIVRTLPNDDTKLTRQYNDVIPPYFTSDAIQYILEMGVRHLLVDVPSIDRLYDEGRLINHRLFWNVDPGSFETNEYTRRRNTITEFVYASNDVSDSMYLINIQIAPFASDASPSRPILFSVR